MKKTVCAIALLAAGAAFSSAHAQGYFGASFGTTELQEDCIRNVSCDLKDSGFKVYGGYMFGPNFAIEGAYADLGTVTYGVPVLGSVVRADVDSTGFGVWGKAVMPIDDFSLFGKLGLAYVDAELSASASGFGSMSASDSNTNIAWGVGAAYNFTPNFGVRAEFERFRLEFNEGKSDLDMLSAGLFYRF